MTAHFGLKFISGKYQGGEFPLPENGEIVIGRSSEAGIVLVEDMISRRHAILSIHGEQLVVNDLGSTNGTFVNGEKIQSMSIKLGDRILVGTSILKVVPLQTLSVQPAEADSKELRAMFENLARSYQGDAAMAGELSEVPLVDLLQLFASNKKSGMLVVTGPNSGNLFLQEGKLVYAQIVNKNLPPRKAAMRMLSWQQGHFELKALGDTKFPQTINETTEHLLIETLRLQDETNHVPGVVPLPMERLVLCRPLRSRLSQLSKEELDWVQLFVDSPNFAIAVDSYPQADEDALLSVKQLIAKGVLEIYRT